ncbi:MULTISPECIES: FKBP-type peptidyl-prolyl cis-trans isomerase [unclassified Novosphingobium]|uniref:FKBP-type peptidyl-prolyl cis-trans isomerase n=1 Tax=unclassified Novosphingobium TaxID=2644732 RepID=UPI0014945E16|nr:MULTISPECIES: FKBP-type peptidyl-prolyl cis-trans isomerase [unclassified Novosphingobium]MBB3356599.1 FKBP-type peptidyl-prolyl cis-trans isomerase FkpA [Novosphingobium sp. BK256]MBB3373000.1 FKBP-type peptidyl-prolyl cis-trans isomerase FkpA [Novosphingobium sp. BK280]MBB3377368.1 FKBP-type peptidyl-prolyl cis-trans isomerase FkpA [Novosphingobium sp. BK258]MBB3419221.1 FKBP-type peptidyl-prolyl cis-trans isomerase FkpA [Novosphingobium sp. BK267]MBB3448962.1 FKBP-type peptidyl-prolyl ci
MITAPSRAARFAMLVSSAVLAASALAAPVAAAPVKRAAVPAARSAAAALSTAILPVPLMPVVPAGQRQCSAKTASGLGTLTLKPSADAAHPAKGDYVLVNYIGYLAADGRVFDQNTAAAFPVEGVIPGFSEGLQLMAKGSTWRFCVPATLGYGAQGAGETIPADADLVFQVELVDYKTAADVEKMRAAAAAAGQPGADGQPATPAPATTPKP